jgi:Flp pilus assembly protein TadB
MGIAMEQWSSILVAVSLLLAAGLLTRSHLRAWQTLQQRRPRLEPSEYDFRRRQLRRRSQTSAMLGLVGIGMLIGRLLIVWRAAPLVVVVFWLGVMGLLVWLALLAVADIVSTRLYFSRLRQNYMVEQARLKAQLRRMEPTGQREQPDDPPREDSEEN